MSDTSLFLVPPVRRGWRAARARWRSWGLPQLPDLLLVWIGGVITWEIGGVLGQQALLVDVVILWSVVALGLVGHGAMRSSSLARRCWGTGVVGLTIGSVGLIAVLALPVSVPVPVPRTLLAWWCGLSALLLIGGLAGDLSIRGVRLLRAR